MTLGSAAAVPAPARAGASRAARPSRWHAGTLAAAGTIPVTAVNAARRPSCRSEGHHPANDRPAIPTRAYESGSGHGHDAAPACHPHPPRPPPHPAVTWWVPGAEPAGPPLRRQGRSLRSRRCATGLRPALDPGDLCGPSRAATTGQATACPATGARHPPGHRRPPLPSPPPPRPATRPGQPPLPSNQPHSKPKPHVTAPARPRKRESLTEPLHMSR